MTNCDNGSKCLEFNGYLYFLCDGELKRFKLNSNDLKVETIIKPLYEGEYDSSTTQFKIYGNYIILYYYYSDLLYVYDLNNKSVKTLETNKDEEYMFFNNTYVDCAFMCYKPIEFYDIDGNKIKVLDYDFNAEYQTVFENDNYIVLENRDEEDNGRFIDFKYSIVDKLTGDKYIYKSENDLFNISCFSDTMYYSFRKVEEIEMDEYKDLNTYIVNDSVNLKELKE